MAGGLMQLVAYGAQDVYLTGNPQITFWKVTYRRHTNFAMESIEQTFNGQADFGRRVQCTISRNGDLAYRTYLQVTLPEINQNDAKHARWLDYPGEQLIDTVEVEIGGQRVDRQFGEWMHIWNQLTMTLHETNYQKMVGHTTELTYLTHPDFAGVDSPCASSGIAQSCQPRNALPATTLYVPLQFWFCRNPGLALPLIALQYHEVRITLDLRPLDECLFATDDQSNHKVVNKSLESASLFVDYIFLDTDERRRMAQNPHEYLIEQLQFTGDHSVGSTSNNIALDFNHPVKELIWVVQKDSLVNKCDEPNIMEYGCQYFNFTDAKDVLPDDILAYSNESAANKIVTPGAEDNNDRLQMPSIEDNVSLEADKKKLDNFDIVNDLDDFFDHITSTNIATINDFKSSIPADGTTFGNTLANNVNNEYFASQSVRYLVLLRGIVSFLNLNITVSDILIQIGKITVDNIKNNDSTTITFLNDVFIISGIAAADTNKTSDLLTSIIDNLKDKILYFNIENRNTSLSSAISDAGAVVLAKSGLNMHCWGSNPVVTARLQLNGQDRFSEREGSYFDQVQPYQHHTRGPSTGINVYSFALRPEEHQPSGTCNFSRIDNANLQLTLSHNTVGGSETAKVRVYAVNYNVLRIMSGMGGLAYSN